MCNFCPHVGQSQRNDHVHRTAIAFTIVSQVQELFHFLKGEPEISALPDKSETLPLRVGVAPMTALS